MTARISSHALGVEVGPAEAGLDQRRPCSSAPCEGVGDEDGALALAQVVAGRLARRGGVAEDPEQVVAQLERLAEVEAVARQRREVVARSAPPAVAPMRSGCSMVYFALL